MKKQLSIILVTGFLGSGKTTFINWLLRTHPQEKVSIILNEFGDVALESQFIQKKGEDVIELSNGCMCCVAKSDIPRVISLIAEQSTETEYILIEASGLSDPEPILESFADSRIKDTIRLETIVCIVDCLHFLSMWGKHAIISAQLADSDIVLLSKSTNIPTDQKEKIKSVLTNAVPHVHVMEIHEALPPELFLNPNQQRIIHFDTPSAHDHIHEDYQTIWYSSEKPIDFEKFSHYMRNLDPRIIRVKGVIAAKWQDGVTKVLIQYIGDRFEPVEGEWNRTESQKTTLLFIGQGIEEDILRSSLDSCLAN